MVQKQRLWIAAAAVLLMVVLAVFSGRQQQPQTGTGAGTWLPGLKEELKAITRVRLQSGAATATLVRDGDRWGIAERDAYPVDLGRLGALLEELAAAKTVEQKTAKPEYFDRLGLGDPAKPGATGVLVEIWTTGAEPAHRVVVGNAAEGRGGRYVRLADAQQTWLVDRSPQALAEPQDWLARGLLDLPFEQVSGVTREVPGGQGFRAERASPGATGLSGVDLPAGRAPRYETVFDGAARAVLGVEPEDVRRADAALFPAAGTAKTRIGFFDGLSLAVEAVKAPDGNWIRITPAAGDPVAAPAAPAGDGSAATDAAAAQVAAEPLPARVEALSGRLGGWAFKVSDYVYGELSKPLGEYLEDDKPAASPGAADEP